MVNHREQLHTQFNCLLEPTGHSLDSCWGEVAAQFLQHNFDKSSLILRAGEHSNRIHFIASGICRYYYISDDGREFNKGFATAGGGAIASLRCLVEQKPSPFYVETLSDTSTLSIERDQLLSLYRHHPAWATLGRMLLEQIILRKEDREAEFLPSSAANRYTNFIDRIGHWAEDIPNYHIASYLGITPVALSRIRNRLGLTQVNEDSATKR